MDFKWSELYSNTDEPDDYGRWSRVLYYKGLLICWVNKFNKFYTIKDYFPTNLNSHSPNFTYSVSVKTDFEIVKKECEDRFIKFKNNL